MISFMNKCNVNHKAIMKKTRKYYETSMINRKADTINEMQPEINLIESIVIIFLA